MTGEACGHEALDRVATAASRRRSGGAGTRCEWRRAVSVKLLQALAVGVAFSHMPAAAHTIWADGTPVPEWVRNACCGPSDIHHLRLDQVRLTPDGYRVEGIRAIVPFAKTLESMDGDYWLFSRNFPDGTQYVFCFFAPPAGF